MDPKSVLEYASKHNAKILDLRFIDVPGIWQHVSYPIKELTADSFNDGFGMDASSIRGWAQIHESDMLLIPDPNTAFMDPFRDTPTLVMICDAQDPLSRKPYDRDVRNLAHRAEDYLLKSGVADQAFFGAEAEFFIFDSAVFDSKENMSYYKVDSDEGRWNSGRMEFPITSGKLEHNLGYRPRYKEGYFPVPPTDHFMDMRTDMVLQMQAVGIDVECHHHEVATAGQCEIDFRFDTLIKAADNMCKYKYVIRNVAQQYGKTVTFMPKPIFSDNGSGMHTHQSLWNKGKPLFAGDQYAGLSQTALWYIGGLLKHAPAIVAFAAPSTNSYKRLVPGFEAPVNLAYSRRNRSAAVRIPMYSANPKAKRLEFRPPDPSCNPYVAYSAMLMAGLDGIENKIDPGGPLDQDIFELSKEELKHVPSVPGSLEESLKALHHDHAFLLKGGVFTKEFIDLWIDYKMTKEVNPMRMRPHPFEFHLYYDI
jgi:glutamine synthetase